MKLIYVFIFLLILPQYLLAQLGQNVSERDTIITPENEEPQFNGFGNTTAISDNGLVIVVCSNGKPNYDRYRHDGETYSSKEMNTGACFTYKMMRGKAVKIEQVLRGYFHNELIGSSVALSADGKTLALGSSGVRRSKVKVYVFDDENDIWVPKGQDFDTVMHYYRDLSLLQAEDLPVDVALSADGNTLAIGASGSESYAYGKVHTYKFNGKGWRLIESLRSSNHNSSRFGTNVELSSDGKRLITTYTNTTVNKGSFLEVFDLENEKWNKKIKHEIEDSDSSFNLHKYNSLSGNGDFISIGSKVYKLLQNNTLKKIKDFGNRTYVVKISNDGSKLIVIDQSRTPSRLVFYKKTESGQYQQNVNSLIANAYYGYVIAANSEINYFAVSSSSKTSRNVKLYSIPANMLIVRDLDIQLIPFKTDN